MKTSALRRFSLMLLCCGLLVLGSACSSTAKSRAAEAQPPRRVLFIGNSYTFYNGGVPAALNWLSKGSLDCTPCVSGGKSLAWHYTQGEALKVLRSERWNDVVLQDYSLEALDKPELMALFIRRFDQEIDAIGARTVLYQTWPRKNAPQNGPQIYKAYEDSAAETRAKLAAVGRAFVEAQKKRPGLELYNADNSHPSPAGTYLAACVFYATLLDRSPVGLESYVIDEIGKPVITLKPEQARFLQGIANSIARPAPVVQTE